MRPLGTNLYVLDEIKRHSAVHVDQGHPLLISVASPEGSGGRIVWLSATWWSVADEFRIAWGIFILPAEYMAELAKPFIFENFRIFSLEQRTCKTLREMALTPETAEPSSGFIVQWPIPSRLPDEACVRMDKRRWPPGGWMCKQVA